MVSSEDKRILVWKNLSEWKSVHEGMFLKILNPELEANIRNNASSVKCQDDPEAFEKLSGHSIESIITTEKVEEFRRLYSHIRVYHACRINDVQSHNDKGL
jgi:hypothetical protein